MFGIKKQIAKYNAQSKSLNEFSKSVRKFTKRQTLNDRLEELFESFRECGRAFKESANNVGYLSAIMQKNETLNLIPALEEEGTLVYKKKKWWQIFYKPKAINIPTPKRKVRITYVQRGMPEDSFCNEAGYINGANNPDLKMENKGEFIFNHQSY